MTPAFPPDSIASLDASWYFLPTLKDPTSKFEKSNIYKLTCEVCAAFYMGQIWKKEYAVTSVAPECSAFGRHNLDSGYPFSFDTSLIRVDRLGEPKIFCATQFADTVILIGIRYSPYV